MSPSSAADRASPGQPPPPAATAETALLTALALCAFAANSLLNRLALVSPPDIDATGYTMIRLLAGALTLAALVRVRAGSFSPLRGPTVPGALALFVYAAPFSYAYVRIGAAVGALVLFGAVQMTMLGGGLARGERPGPRAYLGLALATAGLLLLLLPAARRPDPLGIGLMVLAGVAWGVYSLQGKGVADPLAANARAFLGSVPLALALQLVTAVSAGSFIQPRGLALAALSGAVTSGLGYAVWYRALRGLTASRAAVLQLSVPVIAAAGAVLLLDEPFTGRLALSGVAVIGGVALALTARRPAPVKRWPVSER